MQKVLLSAFSCNPFKGSESAYGWNWSTGLVKEGFEVHTLTRKSNKEAIEEHEEIENLYFHYVSLPIGLENLYSFSQAGMYLYYLLWQWKTYQTGQQLVSKYTFHRIHHISWGSYQLGSFLYKLDAPFLFGPAGGGQKAPSELKKYFLDYWEVEKKREMVNDFLVRFNPACRSMIKNAEAVMVSNKDTEKLVKLAGAKNIHFTLDVTLSDDFFPTNYIEHSPDINNIKLLWVGRFMPRKGLLLVLEVMKELKEYPGITLTIVGDGQMMEAAKNRYKEWQLENSVSFTGYVPFSKVRNFYKSHDLFFFTPLRESGGVQLLEALAFNLPVVTSDHHGPREIINEEVGVRIPVISPQKVVKELSEAIVQLANDSQRYWKMSKAAYEFSRKQRWEEKISDVVEKYY